LKDFGTAAILCGGESRRMGFDKSEIKVGGKLLIEIIAEELEQVFEEIILISNDKEKFKHINYKVVQDIIQRKGPAGGIYTALKYASSKYVFVTACDMPMINLNYIKYMMELIKTKNVEGVATYNCGKIEPLYAFYSIDMLCTFKDQLEKNNFKMFELISHCNMHYVKDEKVREYSKDMNIFTNLNCKSDLRHLQKNS
jgi:molybdopterin-guanine dinucleotide biosynthesis protein A